jgi:hypothetical protein
MHTYYAGMYTYVSPGWGKLSSAFFDLFTKQESARECRLSGWNSADLTFKASQQKTSRENIPCPLMRLSVKYREILKHRYTLISIDTQNKRSCSMFPHIHLWHKMATQNMSKQLLNPHIIYTHYVRQNLQNLFSLLHVSHSVSIQNAWPTATFTVQRCE